MAKRRDPGTGSVWRRGSDGRWVAGVRTGPRGASILRVRFAPKADNTRQAAHALLDELRRSGTRATSKTTLGDFLRAWLSDYRTQVGPKQWANAESMIRLHLGVVAASRIGDVGPEQIRAVLQRMRVARLSPQTVRHLYNVLAVALDQAERDGLIPRNPVRLVVRPRVPRTQRPVWTLEQGRAFLASVRDDPFYPLYLAAMITGLRQAELLGLAWVDVDLDGATANIETQLARRQGQYVRVALKSSRSRAQIALPPVLVASLAEHRRRQRAQRIAAGRPTEEGLVFVSESGRPLNGSAVTHRFQKAAAAAGLPVVPFHSARHFAASLLAAQGVHPRIAMEALGHASIGTTMAIYTHTTTAEARAAAALVEAALMGA
ncbi:MAG: tyrosine-type recombinase/integrase [Candidatus Limnocylindrales bacterium]